MRRALLLALVVLALVVSACAGADDGTVAETSTTQAPGDVTSASDGESDGTTSTSSTEVPQEQPSSTSEAPSAPPEGPPAPDFTLALGEDGSESFTLSDAAMPVYMVFWAEW